MARSFNGSSDYGRNGNGVISSVPCTMAAWFYVGSSHDGALLDVRASAGWAGIDISVRSTGKVRWYVSDTSSVGPVLSSTASYSTNTWQHMAGRSSSSTGHQVFLNGSQSGTDSTSVGAFTTVQTNVGRYEAGGSNGEYLNGRAAEVAVWNVALDDAEIASLAAGFSPLCIRPASLVGYWPLLGRTSPEIDLRSGNALTLTGTSQIDHPRIIYRPTQIVVPAAAAAGGGGFFGSPLMPILAGQQGW